MDFFEVEGRKYLNTLPYDIYFLDSEENFVVMPFSGCIISTKTVQNVTRIVNGVSYVKNFYLPTDQGSKIISQIPEDVIIIGSTTSAMVYSGRVCVPIPCDGFEKALSNEQMLRLDKFIIY